MSLHMGWMPSIEMLSSSSWQFALEQYVANVNSNKFPSIRFSVLPPINNDLILLPKLRSKLSNRFKLTVTGVKWSNWSEATRWTFTLNFVHVSATEQRSSIGKQNIWWWFVIWWLFSRNLNYTFLACTWTDSSKTQWKNLIIAIVQLEILQMLLCWFISIHTVSNIIQTIQNKGFGHMVVAELNHCIAKTNEWKMFGQYSNVYGFTECRKMSFQSRLNLRKNQQINFQIWSDLDENEITVSPAR